MNYKAVFLIILSILIAASLFISVKKPKMHKVAMIYNSDYKIVAENIPENKNEIIPTINQEEQIKTVQKKLIKNTEKNTDFTPVQKKIVKQDNLNNKKNTVAKNVKTIQPTTVKEVKKEPIKKEQVKTVTQTPKINEVKTENKVSVPIQAVEKKEPVNNTVLTKEQEEIAWNIWRSNLQNQIMKDTNLPSIPNGTIFRFTFDVDKYGRITSIQTRSDTPAYTPYAIQYIAPVIRSYQGKNILNFPKGTMRTTTTVKGAWKISTNTRYSTPKDYNDTEVINR